MSEEARKAAIEKAMNGFSSHEEAYTAFCRRNNGLGDWNSHKGGYESGFGDGYDAHTSHTAAIREKAEALVAKHIEVCEADVFEMNFGDGTMMIGMSPKDIYQIGYAAALFGLGPELTALKAALEGKQ